MLTDTTRIREIDQSTLPDGDIANESLDTGFGAEYRGLARQRRFERAAAEAPRSAAAPAARTAPPADEMRARRGAGQWSPAPVAQRNTERVQRQTIAAPARRTEAPTRVERLTSDPMLMIAELSRMADRVIESREALALATARITQLEHENRAFNDRMLAARALVAQAQQTAQSAAEQVAFMEGRCDALDQALDLALNASLIQRWKWRRRANRSVG